MSNRAPYRSDLTVYCGADFSASFVYYAKDGVTPLPMSNAEMDVRQTAGSGSQLVLEPTLSVSGNVVTISISGAASDAVTATGGQYDLFVTRHDTGARDRVLYGTVSFIPNTTLLV